MLSDRWGIHKIVELTITNTQLNEHQVVIQEAIIVEF